MFTVCGWAKKSLHVLPRRCFFANFPTLVSEGLFHYEFVWGGGVFGFPFSCKLRFFEQRPCLLLSAHMNVLAEVSAG